jgi:hypothetical protein
VPPVTTLRLLRVQVLASLLIVEFELASEVDLSFSCQGVAVGKLELQAQLIERLV